MDSKAENKEVSKLSVIYTAFTAFAFKMLFDKVSFKYLSTPWSMLACFLMGAFYVLSLYVWSNQYRFNRNASSVIIRRFISVILTCIVSYIFIGFISERDNTGQPLFKWVGLRVDLYVLASVSLSLILTTILFAGPIVQYLIGSYASRYSQNMYLNELERARINQQQQQQMQQHNDNDNELNRSNTDANESRPVGDGFSYTVLDHFGYLFSSRLSLTEMKRNFSDLVFWRNVLVGPFTEEFVFRSCMLPLLVANLDYKYCIFITPLFFGLAHLHHMLESYKVNNMPLKHLIMQHLFQFAYTYIFGVYSSYLFIRTGNFFASFVSHAFCNVMGFPNIGELMHDFDRRTRNLLVFMYVLGLVLFIVLLLPLTTPKLFDNYVYFNLTLNSSFIGRSYFNSI